MSSNTGTQSKNPNPRTLRAKDYHVAWISAIRKEYVIACAMLDEVHGDPPDRLEDHRFYTFGCINGHNVVIARLPEGTVGIDNAASLAADMANAFPNVRFGLVVGIAGGAPTLENDIRLGDIVVSVPDDKKRLGGVVQYDFGASIQEKGFTRRGSLDRPPSILLNAVGELQARYDALGHEIEAVVEQMINKSSRKNLRVYNRPNPPTDTLFMPGFVHTDAHQSCAALGCFDDLSHIVTRKRRGISPDQLVIHLGIVGSGGTLMRDAYMRDSIAQIDGVKCFEMESAGLMNNRLRWLVIRGICDYCDTHKNDNWQMYAAAVAAVYARELLSVVRPAKLDLLSDLQSSQPPAVPPQVDKRQKLRDALVFEGIDARASQLRNVQIPSQSFDWIWTTRLKIWLENEQPLFWITGKPGSGKSTLMNFLQSSSKTRKLLHKSSRNYTILKFFFDFRASDNEANTISGLMRNLLLQITRQNSKLEEKLANKNESSPFSDLSEADLIEIFADTIKDSKQGICTFIDGLDDFTGDHLRLANTLSNIQQQVGFKFCLASRPHAVFQHCFANRPLIRMQDHNSRSISVYIDQVFTTYSHQGRGNVDLLNANLRAILLSKAEGVIIWARVAVDEIARLAIAGATQEELANTLKALPSDLEHMYIRVLASMSTTDREDCALLLMVLCHFGHGSMNLSDLITCWTVCHSRQSRPVHPEPGRMSAQRALMLLGNLAEGTEGKSVIARLHGKLRQIFPWPVARNDMTKMNADCEVRIMHETLHKFVCNSPYLFEALGYLWKGVHHNTFALRVCCFMVAHALGIVGASISMDPLHSLVHSITSKEYLDDSRRQYVTCLRILADVSKGLHVSLLHSALMNLYSLLITTDHSSNICYPDAILTLSTILPLIGSVADGSATEIRGRTYRDPIISIPGTLAYRVFRQMLSTDHGKGPLVTMYEKGIGDLLLAASLGYSRYIHTRTKHIQLTSEQWDIVMYMLLAAIDRANESIRYIFTCKAVQVEWLNLIQRYSTEGDSFLGPVMLVELLLTHWNMPKRPVTEAYHAQIKCLWLLLKDAAPPSLLSLRHGVLRRYDGHLIFPVWLESLYRRDFPEPFHKMFFSYTLRGDGKIWLHHWNRAECVQGVRFHRSAELLLFQLKVYPEIRPASAEADALVSRLAIRVSDMKGRTKSDKGRLWIEEIASCEIAINFLSNYCQTGIWPDMDMYIQKTTATSIARWEVDDNFQLIFSEEEMAIMNEPLYQSDEGS